MGKKTHRYYWVEGKKRKPRYLPEGYDFLWGLRNGDIDSRGIKGIWRVSSDYTADQARKFIANKNTKKAKKVWGKQ